MKTEPKKKHKIIYIYAFTQREILYRHNIRNHRNRIKRPIGLRKHVQTKNYKIKILTGMLINGLELKRHCFLFKCLL